MSTNVLPGIELPPMVPPSTKLKIPPNIRVNSDASLASKHEGELEIQVALGNVTQEEKDKWEGRNRRKLSEEGYRSLAILSTFLAGVQAQVLSSTLGTQGAAYDVINAFFIGGLLADIFASMISYGSARWFEMLTLEEGKHLHDCTVKSEKGEPVEGNKKALVDVWVSFSIAMGPYAVLVGLVLLITGLMILAWTRQPVVVKAISTVICAFFVFFVPPFALRHNRTNVLSLLKLKRRSG